MRWHGKSHLSLKSNTPLLNITVWKDSVKPFRRLSTVFSISVPPEAACHLLTDETGQTEAQPGFFYKHSWTKRDLRPKIF